MPTPGIRHADAISEVGAAPAQLGWNPVQPRVRVAALLGFNAQP